MEIQLSKQTKAVDNRALLPGAGAVCVHVQRSALNTQTVEVCVQGGSWRRAGTHGVTGHKVSCSRVGPKFEPSPFTTTKNRRKIYVVQNLGIFFQKKNQTNWALCSTCRVEVGMVL